MLSNASLNGGSSLCTLTLSRQVAEESLKKETVLTSSRIYHLSGREKITCWKWKGIRVS